MARPSRQTVEAIDSVIKGHKAGETARNRNTLFDKLDRDGSGSIDRTEFARLYSTIKTHVAADAEREQRVKARTRALSMMAIAMGLFLAISIVANFVTTYMIVDSQIQQKSDSTGAYVAKTVPDTIVKAAASEIDLPLTVAPALDNEVLNAVKSLQVQTPAAWLMEHGLDEESTFAGKRVVVKYQVTGFVKKNEATMMFQTTRGDNIRIEYGVATIETPSGKQFAICESLATSTMFKASGVDVAAADAATKAEVARITKSDRSRKLREDREALMAACN